MCGGSWSFVLFTSVVKHRERFSRAHGLVVEREHGFNCGTGSGLGNGRIELGEILGCDQAIDGEASLLIQT